MSRVTGAVNIFGVGDKTGSGVGKVLVMACPCLSHTPAVRLVVMVLAFFLATLSCSDFDFGYQTRAPIKKKENRLKYYNVFLSIGDHALYLVVRLGMALHCCQLDSFTRGHKEPYLDSRYRTIIVVVRGTSQVCSSLFLQSRKT
jgi:hypothetical protein